MKQSGAKGALGTLESPDAGAPTLAEINLCKLRGQSSVAIALAQQRLESVPDCATTHALLGELYENAGHITDLLFGMNREEKTTLILVTHNLELAQRTERIIQMKGGRVIGDKVLSLV